MSKKNFVILLIILTLLGIAGVTYTKQKGAGQDVVSNFEIPNGWHKHQAQQTNVLLTRNDSLPTLNNTELWALGEQIRIETAVISESFEEWANAYIADEALTHVRKQYTANEHDGLWIEQEAAGADGEILVIYIFDDNKVHTFTLYPLYVYDEVSKKRVRNSTGITTLETVVQNYTANLEKD